MKRKRCYESPTFDCERLFGGGGNVLLASPVDSGDGLGLYGYDLDNGIWW